MAAQLPVELYEGSSSLFLSTHALLEVLGMDSRCTEA